MARQKIPNTNISQCVSITTKKNCILNMIIGLNDACDNMPQLGIPIPDPFSQSWDSGISNPGIPVGLWDPSSMTPKTVIRVIGV